MPLATELGTAVTYNVGLPLIKSYDPVVKWSCEVTQQIEYVTFLFVEDLLAPN